MTKRNEHFILDGVEVKECRGCGRTLPVNSIYWGKNKNTPDGILYRCRECAGSRFIYDIPPKITKICNKCGCERPNTSEYFSKAKSCRDGLNYICKKCNKEYKTQYNLLHRKEGAREYRSRSPAELRLSNAEYKRLWNKENKEKRMISRQKRRSMKKQLPSTLTTEQWNYIKQYFNNRCCYCGKEKPLQQDHFIPVAKGGEYTHNNIVPACQTCNYSKHDKSFFDWYPKYKNYSKKREKQILNFLGYSGESQQLALM